MGTDENSKRGAVRWLALSASLCVIAYMGLTLYGDHAEVIDALVRVGIAGVASALALSLVNILLRFLRWGMFLAVMGEKVPVLANLQIYLAGLGLMTTPAKAGMAIRSVFLRRRGVSYPRSLAAFFAERFCDLTGLLLIAASGMAFHPAAPFVLGALAAICVVYLLIAGRTEHLQGVRDRLRAHGSRWSAILGHAVDMLLESGRCLQGKYLITGIVLGMLANLAHALALYNMLITLGGNVGPGLIAVIFSLSTLAGSLSMMPGGLGGAEAAMLALLVAVGVERPLAVAATLFSRLTSLWFTVLLGVLALFSLGWRGTEEPAGDTSPRSCNPSTEMSRRA